MSYLVYFDDKANLILRPECYKLSPCLSEINEKELSLICLGFDYHSLYRQFPEQDRIRRAMFHVFDDAVPELLKEPRIIAAIDAYKGLQYDHDIELVNAYKEKIRSLQEKLKTDDSPTSNKNTLSVISQLRADIRNIEAQVVEKMQDEGQIRGGKAISFLEKLTANQKLYKSVIAPKKAVK